MVTAEEGKQENSSFQNTSIQDSPLFSPQTQSVDLSHTQTFTKWRFAYFLKHSNPLSFIGVQRRTTFYIQPIDEFPGFISDYCIKVGDLNLNFFELIQGFTQIFFSGCDVTVQRPILVSENDWNIHSRVHEVTGQKQYLVNDFYPLLHAHLPANGIGNIAVVWTDIYPKDFNFVLGEASANHRSAVISFGRFETKGFDIKSHEDITEVTGKLLWKIFKVKLFLFFSFFNKI